MITYNLMDTGTDSLYEHLCKCIKKDIIQGNLMPGEKLPSKRVFASNLGVSVITVENAYAQLVAEGYIYSMAEKRFLYCRCRNAEREETGTCFGSSHATAGKRDYLVCGFFQ